MSRRRVLGGTLLAVLAAGLALVALLVGEAVYASRLAFLGAAEAVDQHAAYGSGEARPLALVVAGDSTAAGVGASGVDTTAGGRLAALLARRLGRAVRLTGIGVSGARAGDVEGQLGTLAAGLRPDIVVVLVGANDAIHRTSLGDVERQITAAVTRARATGAAVVVGTCPDLGAGRALPRPLRDLAAWRGRAVARVTARAARRAGARTVDLEALAGPAFRADASTLARDRWHPSDHGYAVWAEALAPETLAAGESVPR